MSHAAGAALGQQVHYHQAFSRQLLQPIERALGRAELGLAGQLGHEALPFEGVDLWTAFELSWLDPRGKPVIAVATLWVPATSRYLVESKSLKLYFGALAQTRWKDIQALTAVLQADLCAVTGAAVRLELQSAEEAAHLQPAALPGDCLDGLPLQTSTYHVDPGLLRLRAPAATAAPAARRLVYSDLFRSNCPVTGQPDWGSVLLAYRGACIEPVSLLAYLVSYRLHVGFHEQCVERIFVDVQRHCRPDELAVYARFTRRGGLDINPFRSSGPAFEEIVGDPRRTWRQ